MEGTDTSAQLRLGDAGLPDVAIDVVAVDSGCAHATVRGRLKPTNLLFVLDQSGSMVCNLPEDGQSSEDCDRFPLRRFADKPSKWELTRDALNQALDALSTSGDVRVAFSMFPRQGTRCTVSVEPTIDFVQLDAKSKTAVSAQLATLTPSGETPLAGATILSYAYLLDSMKAGGLDGETFVVVLTDGVETCETGAVLSLLSEDAPNALKGLGVRTFVVGAPGSEGGRRFLSELAVQGGTPASRDCFFGPEATDGNCHFDMTQTKDFGSDLLDALVRINSEAVVCAIDVPQDPLGGSVLHDQVNVSLDGVSQPMKAKGDCATTDGWRYTEGFAQIRLCGEVCRQAKRPGAKVDVILGCPTRLR